MLKKIYHLSDEGNRRLVKAGLCMCLYNLACLLPVILLAMVADEMLERYFGTVQGSIPLWGYWGTALILLLLIFLTYRMTYRNKYLTSGQETEDEFGRQDPQAPLVLSRTARSE